MSDAVVTRYITRVLYKSCIFAIIKLRHHHLSRLILISSFFFVVIDPANFIYSVPWNSIRNSCRHIALNDRLLSENPIFQRFSIIYIECKGQRFSYRSTRQRQTIIHSRPPHSYPLWYRLPGRIGFSLSNLSFDPGRFSSWSHLVRARIERLKSWM